MEKINKIQKEVKELIRDKRWEILKHKLLHILPPDIAEIIKSLDGNGALIILRLLPTNIQSDVFFFFDRDIQLHLINNIDE